MKLAKDAISARNWQVQDGSQWRQLKADAWLSAGNATTRRHPQFDLAMSSS
jgi:hypothetical protein